ncbi:hypothetical protein LINGRAHAP2_LOCUS5471 [Linum grandiflorum]
MAEGGALVRYSWKGRTTGKGNPYLSPVRTNIGKTCLYRAFCDCLDARARLLAEKHGLHFEGRFSVQRILEMEKLFLTDSTKAVEDCIAYFAAYGEHLLPIIYPPNNELSFRIAEFYELDITDETAAEIREIVRTDGPIIGRHAIHKNYKDTTRAYDADLSANYEDPGEGVGPLRVDDTVPKTPPSEGFEPIVANENPAPQRAKKTPHHAVCIVGYGKENDKEVYEVQDNQGRNFGNGGFRFVTRSTMLKAYVVKLQLERRVL